MYTVSFYLSVNQETQGPTVVSFVTPVTSCGESFPIKLHLLAIILCLLGHAHDAFRCQLVTHNHKRRDADNEHFGAYTLQLLSNNNNT